MSLRVRLAALPITAAIVAAALAGPAYASGQPPRAAPRSAVAAERPENDDLVPMALGTAGAMAAAAAVAGVGYLYRRHTGIAGHYEDGFTPRDPRDQASH